MVVMTLTLKLVMIDVVTQAGIKVQTCDVGVQCDLLQPQETASHIGTVCPSTELVPLSASTPVIDIQYTSSESEADVTFSPFDGSLYIRISQL